MAMVYFGWLLCFVCCVLWLCATFLARPTTTYFVEVDIGLANMANFCAFITKNASPNHPNVKTLPKSSWCEDFGNALTFWWNGSVGVDRSVQKACIILPR